MNRFTGAALAAGLSCVAGAGPALGQEAVDPGAPNWNGIWLRQGGISWDPTTEPGEVDQPPLTPEYQAKYDQSLADLAEGRPTVDPTASCRPPGALRLMNMVYPMEIFQRPGQVAIFAEWDHEVRRIYTDGREMTDDLGPRFNGYSTGHWEGEELVVVTDHLQGPIVLNQSGLQMSDQVVMHERWTQTGPDTLTDTITLVDPKALTEPYTVVKTFERAPEGFEIMEYYCMENNRNPVMEDGSVGVILYSGGEEVH